MVSFQPSMQVQDDLATLFSRNLTFNPEVQSQAPLKVEEELKQQTPGPAPANAAPAPIIYSISQHYTPNAHIVRQQQQEPQPEVQRPSSEPPQTEQITPELVLAQHGVDTSVLSPAQFQLFRISEEPHQLRLIELWREAPPTSSNDNPTLAWTSTTLEQEEQLARMRYERMEAERQQQQQQVMSLDGTQIQADDSRWLASSISHHVEPYMMSGYEEMMRREQEREQRAREQQAQEQREREQAELLRSSGNNYSHYGSAVGSLYKPATDPVYKGFGDDWAREQQMQMENQYGAYEAWGGNMEAMEI